MAALDDELLIDAEDNAREIAYIREQLPVELKDKFSDADILYVMDAIVEYFYNSGVLDSQPDDEGYVDIDMQAVADNVCGQAAAEGRDYEPEEVLFIVQADMDFQEENL